MDSQKNELNRGQINKLVEKYFDKENYQFPGDFNHSLDVISSGILYSMLRQFKPKRCLEFGTYYGGTTCIIQTVLIKNGGKFKFITFEKMKDFQISTLTNVLHKCKSSPEMWGEITQNLKRIPEKLDFVFIDSDWDIIQNGYPDEVNIGKWTYENIIPRIKKGGLICIHDWSVNKDLVYEGGGFPGIYYFIDKFKEGTMPLQKLFSVWDEEDYRKSSIALSFWRKL